MIGTYTNQRKMLDDVKENFREKGPQILQLLREITPEGQLDGEIPSELRDILDLLAHLDRPLAGVDFKLYTAEELREIRSGLSDVIEKIHLLLYKYYKNDQRLHFEVMHVISMANNAIRDADERYKDLFVTGEVGGGDLGTLRNDTMNKKQKFSLQDGSASVDLSPSMFEGWMQIYKTPKAAIEAASRYEKLGKKARTDAEEREFGKLTRMASLAKDFSRSHRYMMEKNVFSGQDMDYAFALEKKEKAGLSDESLSGGKTSAAVYQSLILEQVFKGMKERDSGFINQNNIEENQDEEGSGGMAGSGYGELHQVEKRRDDQNCVCAEQSAGKPRQGGTL